MDFAVTTSELTTLCRDAAKFVSTACDKEEGELTEDGDTAESKKQKETKQKKVPTASPKRPLSRVNNVRQVSSVFGGGGKEHLRKTPGAAPSGAGPSGCNSRLGFPGSSVASSSGHVNKGN
jgi:hypothetical protein